MDANKKLARQRGRRQGHVRRMVRGTDERPRLSVFRSSRHIYAQIIDDESGRTLAAASTMQKDVIGDASTGTRDAATKVGQTLAERARAAGVTRIAFDRGYCKYHGRVAALAQAARTGGLEF